MDRFDVHLSSTPFKHEGVLREKLFDISMYFVNFEINRFNLTGIIPEQMELSDLRCLSDKLNIITLRLGSRLYEVKVHHEPCHLFDIPDGVFTSNFISQSWGAWEFFGMNRRQFRCSFVDGDRRYESLIAYFMNEYWSDDSRFHDVFARYESWQRNFKSYNTFYGVDEISNLFHHYSRQLMTSVEQAIVGLKRVDGIYNIHKLAWDIKISIHNILKESLHFLAEKYGYPIEQDLTMTGVSAKQIIEENWSIPYCLKKIASEDYDRWKKNGHKYLTEKDIESIRKYFIEKHFEWRKKKREMSYASELFSYNYAPIRHQIFNGLNAYNHDVVQPFISQEKNIISDFYDLYILSLCEVV
jgi:hypothetical protein